MIDLLELYRIADQEGITVDCFELAKKESLSMMDHDGECFIAIDPLKLTSSDDEKAKLAHELGHCVTGSFYNRHAACDVRQKHENRADKWAIQNLVPASELNAAVADGRTEIWDLAEYFGVTEEFMTKAVCWYSCGNLDTTLYFSTCCREMKREGWLL